MQADRNKAASLRRLMDQRGYLDVPSHGFSMYPLIRSGNVCRFVPVQPSELKAGDIVLFSTGGDTLIGHRFYRTVRRGEETFYVFKGDSNVSFDPLVRGEQIVGKMVRIGKPGRLLQTGSFWMRLWAAAIVRFPAVSKAIHRLMRINRYLRGMKMKPWIS